jgi:hypothetical protein
VKGVPDMKLVFAKSDLVNAINISLKAVPSKTTMPILECILIEASPSEIKLTSNDMELGIETLVKGDVLERGKIAIDAKLFSEIIRKLPDSDITIETDDRLNVSISCENGRLVITPDAERAAMAEAEAAFMERGMASLKKKFEAEKSKLHAQFVAERESAYSHTNIID